MKILPYEKYTIQSNKSLNDIYASIDQNHQSWKVSFNYDQKLKPLFGKRKGESFRLYRAIAYGNAFLPIAYGLVKRDNKKQSIDIVLKMSQSVSIFIGLFLLIAFIFPIFYIIDFGFSIRSLMGFALFLLSYLLMQLSFWVEVPKIKKIMNKVLV